MREADATPDSAVARTAARVVNAARNEEGQGLVEYSLLILLIALVCIGALTLLGTSVGDFLNTVVGSFP